ncbi:MAG TPA: cysteine--tRNA ligase, partial [Tepidisphaeraceae bacterium]
VYKGYEVTWVVNITDVEDKLIEAAAKRGASVDALAKQYTEEYLDCLARLGIDTIDRFPKASEHIQEIIALCITLIEKGHAYDAGGNVYFDVTKDEDYGKLSRRKLEEQESGLRAIEAEGKRNPADFALWKAAKPGEPAWDSPWGKGRPGWHIECSAMSMKYLGKTLDMHGGGMDLLFPHHENELAQSESATGQPFVHFWMHNGLTRIKTKLSSGEWADEKMSGSIGNVVSAKQLIEELGPDLFRYFILSTHYRRPIEYTDEVIDSTHKGLDKFVRLFERIERIAGHPLSDQAPEMATVAPSLMDGEHGNFAKAVLGFKMKFLEMMDDDFNTAGAIAVLHELAGETNAFIESNNIERDRQPNLVEAAAAAIMTLRNLGAILGLFKQKGTRSDRKDSADIDKLLQLLIELRKQARLSKNFALADTIRDNLAKIGFTLEDRPDGTSWRKGT